LFFGGAKGFSITDLYLFLATVLWGFRLPLRQDRPPRGFPRQFCRHPTLIATGPCFPFFSGRKKIGGKPRHLLYLIGLALLGTFINRVFWSKGIDLTTASNASLLSTTSPFLCC